MEKENILEIEYQDVFDKVAVRIKKLDDDFFVGGLLKEDVEKYNCSFVESPTDLEQRIIWIYDDIYLSDKEIHCYCEEKIKKIKEFVDYVNEKYGGYAKDGYHLGLEESDYETNVECEKCGNYGGDIKSIAEWDGENEN